MDVILRVVRSDLIRLAKFLAPLAFTEIAIDIGEQVRAFLHANSTHNFYVSTHSLWTSFSIEASPRALRWWKCSPDLDWPTFSSKSLSGFSPSPNKRASCLSTTEMASSRF